MSLIGPFVVRLRGVAAQTLDNETAAEILRRAARHSRLSPQFSASGSGLTNQEILAYVISPEGEPITLESEELVEAASVQLARELIAECVRLVQAQQLSVPGSPQHEIPVPTTGQPHAQDRSDVRGLKLVGDHRALRIALGPIELGDVSGQAQVERDTGELYGAFAAGGTVIRLRTPTLIEIAHPNLIGVRSAQA